MGAAIALENILAIVFGIPTLIATILGIRYRCAILDKICTYWKRQSHHDLTSCPSDHCTRSRSASHAHPSHGDEFILLDFPRLPCIFDVARAEQLAWQQQSEEISSEASGSFIVVIYDDSAPPPQYHE